MVFNPAPDQKPITLNYDKNERFNCGKFHAL
jgi:hypothetical protein